VLTSDQLNTYDVLIADDIVFTESALETFLGGYRKSEDAS
jgi:large subunit ribosomal protein L4